MTASFVQYSTIFTHSDLLTAERTKENHYLLQYKMNGPGLVEGGLERVGSTQ
jgi:hypothetical protein